MLSSGESLVDQKSEHEAEECVVEFSDHNSASEQDISDVDSSPDDETLNFYLGKDKMTNGTKQEVI